MSDESCFHFTTHVGRARKVGNAGALDHETHHRVRASDRDRAARLRAHFAPATVEIDRPWRWQQRQRDPLVARKLRRIAWRAMPGQIIFGGNCP